MTYAETLDYMFNALPMFQRIGAAAFKKDLSNTIALCKHLGNPEKQFKSIHVAGTNGKGSSSHMLAAILMQAGYKVGLYTSPHLKSFTERIKINGQEISKDAVIDFVEANRAFLDDFKPSFFEMTVGMAFWHFAKEQVDIAIVEVGMGGRLDSTNVIEPELALITNIGFDHMQFLGETLPLIAGEKAGIIKSGIPVIISQTQQAVKSVFQIKAREEQALLFFAEDFYKVHRLGDTQGVATYSVQNNLHETFQFKLQLLGKYQEKNLAGILKAIDVLQSKGWKISLQAITQGLSRVVDLTGLKGRWQILGSDPLVICDTGHNEDGIRMILDQLTAYSFQQLWIVLGMVQDKDVSKVLAILPKNASYICCQATIPRAMKAADLARQAEAFGLKAVVIPDVNEAIAFAKKKAVKEDLIFIGGSTFVVAEIKDL
ncbi:bifunctional folylpolyglutamate synthase/dihydrofolate synthase [Mongoliitalea daihaiensis]|uniref:bifunctional folylpolyglutamate synthase/dihydrofolate synthase n=1 Tax=Mongoliitalea daihaiensis TaxID=2782006 RepID=UPI001F229CF6|nr:folylpolyglutamate synthase/dihydrofolate synthase family protein [Mongoliitalea daihaiensis]UJP64279.1 bifunctional folylpolyglutamate synthase/dihydrofolate synthase [Mongoliitalea daihaiensis]